MPNSSPDRHNPPFRNLYFALRTPHPALLLIVGALAAAWVFLLPAAFSQSQAGFANAAFKATWDRTDGAVAVGAVKRPWVWGPTPGRTLSEPFQGLPGNSHLVQYFDKGRMELNNPNGDPKNPFYVTSGLLAVELISGQLQTGTATYESRSAAAINLASDADDPSAPTYQSFNGVSNVPGAPNERRKTAQLGQLVRTAIDRQGNTQPWPADHPDYGVHIAYFEASTGHNIPDVFWTYLNQETVIFRDGDLVQGRLFDPWFSITGLPISEPYWSYVKVEGRYTDVLIQAFERRVLTFVPHLPSPFKVQMGNIGQHYFQWRYLTATTPPTPKGTQLTPTVPAQAPKLNVTVDSIQPRTSLIDLNSNYCTITNRESAPVSFNGWFLDSPKFSIVDRFYFPNGVLLQPSASMKVHAGPGNNTPTDVYMYRTSVMWDGQPYDLAVLYDNTGREVDRFFPATDAGAPPPTQPPTGPKPSPTTSGSVPPKPTVPPQGTGAPALTPTKAAPPPQPTGQPTLGTGVGDNTPTRTPIATTTPSAGVSAGTPKATTTPASTARTTATPTMTATATRTQ